VFAHVRDPSVGRSLPAIVHTRYRMAALR
jgi:hypothetical protein